MQKYKMEIIQAHNGAEIISLTKNEYRWTEFDSIMQAYREQQWALRKRNRPRKRTRTPVLWTKKFVAWCLSNLV